MANTLNLGNGNWATKEDSLLGYNSENGNFKPLSFDFTRASSATVVNKAGLIETVGSGEPRIDFKDDAKGALLLEPSRSNLITYSEDTTEWDKNATPINTSNTTISPNGYRNADSVIVNSISEGFYDFSIGTVNSGASYTFSIFIKHISGIETIRFGGSGSGFGGDNNNVFNIKNGTVVSVASGNTLSVNDYGNGWYRLIATKTASSTATAAWVLYGDENAEIQYSAWGVQVEQGSYATSYIPTSGSAVTRVADECFNQPPTGIISQTELTVFYQGIVERLGGNDGHAISLSQSLDASGSSRILLYRNSGNGNVYIYVQDSTTQFSTPLLVNSDPQVNDKYAIAIKDNDLVVYCNGVKVSENNSGTIPSMQYVYLNKWNNQINEQNKIKEVKLYNTRLSNSELAALTQ